MKATTKTDTREAREIPAPTDAPKKPRRGGAVLSIAIFVIAALMVGVLVTVFINSSGNDKSSGTAEEQGITAALERQYGDNWRSLGALRWTYDPVTATVFYFDADEWPILGKERQDEIIKELWTDIKDYRDDQGEEPGRVFIMIHDEDSVMLGAYSLETGRIEY